MEHTATPWMVCDDLNVTRGGSLTIESHDSDGYRTIVAEIFPCNDYWPHSPKTEPVSVANAALIVKAVNSHQALLDALRAVVFAHDRPNPAGLDVVQPFEQVSPINQARAALALVEGK